MSDIYLILSVGQNALQLSLRSGLDSSLDLIILGGLGQSHGQIDDRDISSWHTEGHTGELAVEVRDDLADGLGSASRRRDDVGGSSTASTPVLVRWTIDGLLSGRVRVHGGHETLDDAELVVDDLSQWRQAVGCARRVAEDVDRRVVCLLVDTAHEHGRISRWRRDDDLLGSTL